jgi:hypothetical protein
LPLRPFSYREIEMAERKTGGKRPSTALGTNEAVRITPNKHRTLQLTRPGKRKLFGRAAKQDFLEWFAATANLGWSARQAGFNYKTVLRHRMNDPVFAEAYDRALRQGYARLQGQLLETEIAEGAEAPIGIEGDRDVPEMQKMDPDRALALLREHGRYLAGRGAGAGEARKQGRRPRAVTNAEVRTALEAALRVFERRIGPEEGTP